MAQINLGTDTPVAAMKRGETFWRFQGLVTPNSVDAPFIALGPIKPAAIQVGPGSWIDTFRVWSMPPGAPQQAVFQDVSTRAPLVSPITYYPKTVTQTGGNAVTPQLYVYLVADQNALTETFAGGAANLPVAPRIFSPDSFPFAVWVDLIVYFKAPSTFPQGRPMLNNAFLSTVPGATYTVPSAIYAARGTTTPTTGTGFFTIPTYGRQRINWSLSVDTDMPWSFWGTQLTQAGTIVHTIATGTVLSTTPVSYVLTGARYDYVTLAEGAGAVAGTVVGFTFEAED